MNSCRLFALRDEQMGQESASKLSLGFVNCRRIGTRAAVVAQRQPRDTGPAGATH